jgi:hypothetical protein
VALLMQLFLNVEDLQPHYGSRENPGEYAAWRSFNYSV